MKWYSSYFSQRSQYCKLGDKESERLKIEIGVPQGSLLGVLCFQLMINDINKSIKYSNLILYADDTTIYLLGKNLRFLQCKLQQDLVTLSVWLQNNQLVLNVKKTKAMLFTSGIHYHNLELRINGEKLEFVYNFKFLGLVIDEKLCWEDHVMQLYNKLLKTLYILTKLKNIVPVTHLRKLYFAHFHSKLVYGITIWGTTCKKSLLEKLILLQ